MIDFFDRGVRIASGEPCIVTAAASNSYAAVDAASRRIARFLIDHGFPAGGHAPCGRPQWQFPASFRGRAGDFAGRQRLGHGDPPRRGWRERVSVGSAGRRCALRAFGSRRANSGGSYGVEDGLSAITILARD